MHVVRVLAALVFGGLASIALAHLLAEAFRPIWGDQAAVRAVFGAPVVILFSAWVIVLLTRPVRWGEPIFTVQHHAPALQFFSLDELQARAHETLRLLEQIPGAAAVAGRTPPVGEAVSSEPPVPPATSIAVKPNSGSRAEARLTIAIHDDCAGDRPGEVRYVPG